MGWAKFHIKVPGKWVLAGEHSVLRGFEAIALRHPGCFLELTYSPENQEGSASGGGLRFLSGEMSGYAGPLIDKLLEKFLPQKAFKNLPHGTIEIKNTIPIGAGFGSSAALSVAVVRWFQSEFDINEDKVFALARECEDIFHGKSSGMDIAAVLSKKPILFSKENGATPLDIQILPKFTFHDTGVRSYTSDCIGRVKNLAEKDRALSTSIDRRMGEAVRICLDGLLALQEHEATLVETMRLAEGMKLAQSCFNDWGLVGPKIQKQIGELLNSGALAVKLTGAGGGGMLVALWA